MIHLTRRYRFSAAHVLALPSASDAENRRIYGKCANPGGHGHNYGVEVTVAGPLDERTGRVMDPTRLDELFAEKVASRFAHRLLNRDPAFRRTVPTAENVARVIFGELGEPVAASGSARLLRVRVVETRRNSFVFGEMP